MGSLINSATAPLGVKLFSGPPYSDRQIGDQSLAASKPLQSAGTNFLNLSQGQAGANNPYASLMNQIGYESGVQSPFGGGTSGSNSDPLGPNGPLGAKTNANQYDASGKYIGGGLSTFGQNTGNTAQGTPSNPGELTGSYLDMYSNLKGHTEKARANALSQLNAHLSARGLGDSSEARAHQAYLNSQFDNHLADTMSQLQGQQHQERLQTLQQFINNLQGFGAMGGNLISGNVQNLNQNAQAATQRTNQGNAALGSALGLGLGAAGVMPMGMNQFQSPFSRPSSNTGVAPGPMFGPPDSMMNSSYNPYMQNQWWNPVAGG